MFPLISKQVSLPKISQTPPHYSERKKLSFNSCKIVGPPSLFHLTYLSWMYFLKVQLWSGHSPPTTPVIDKSSSLSQAFKAFIHMKCVREKSVTGGVDQVVQHLPSKCKVLRLPPVVVKKKKKYKGKCQWLQEIELRPAREVTKS
jgi:hypothetical protein